MSATEPCIYFLLGDKRQILYVGSTSNFERRFKEHARTQPWWHMVRDANYFIASSRREAYEVERWAIKKYHPPFNTSLIPAADDLSPLLSVDGLARARSHHQHRASANAAQAERIRERCLTVHGVDLATLLAKSDQKPVA